MTLRRLRQANLMGPAGYVSLDDSEVMQLAQQGVAAAPEDEGLLEVGLDDTGDVEHIVTEVAIREFYRYYRRGHGAVTLGAAGMAGSAAREVLERLYVRYVDALDDDQLEAWPELFTETCLYRVMSAENDRLGLPLAVIRAESRGT